MSDKKNLIIIILIVAAVILLFVKMCSSTSSKDDNNIINGKLECEIDTSDSYHITYLINYKLTNATEVRITYKDLKANRNSENYSETDNDMSSYQMLSGSTYEYLDKDLVIVLPRKVYDSNKENNRVKNIFAKSSKAQKYLENLGYRCKE